jgi:chromosome segregation ATPase
MELIVLLLSSISGALIGTSVGIYLLYRKLRPITGAELDLTRGKLRSTEFSLASTTANLEQLRKHLDERDQQVTAAGEKAQGLEAEAANLRQQLAEHDNKVAEAAKAVSDTASKQIAGFEAQIDADDRQIKELNGQVSRLTVELEEVRAHLKEETDGRTGLEAQLTTEHDHSRRLASRIAELEAERSHFDLTMQEERQSAAKGIELLLMAQENLTRVFRHIAPPIEATAESNGHALVAVSAGSPTE